jgi:peptidoglycan/LPS O-acetylase OafA/YrhL
MDRASPFDTGTGEDFSATVRHAQSWTGACLIAYALDYRGRLNNRCRPRSGFNRKVLSHPIMVWFGLISYPLYLWDWPLHSFARIMVGEVPTASIRIAAVALSVPLAWLTCILLERPIRRGGRAGLKVAVLRSQHQNMIFVNSVLTPNFATERSAAHARKLPSWTSIVILRLGRFRRRTTNTASNCGKRLHSLSRDVQEFVPRNMS